MCNLHWCYTFCTGVTRFALVLHLNCTALSQSESSNFFMCIIREKDALSLQVNFQSKKIEGTDQQLTKNCPRRFFSVALVPLTDSHHRLNTLR